MFRYRKYSIQLLIISLVFLGLTSKAQYTFQKYFSEPSEYQRLSLSPNDDTYILSGTTRDKGGYYDIAVVKLKQNGEVIWSTTYPSQGDDYASGLAVSASGDIIISGYKPNEQGNFDYTLMKISPIGKLQWYKTYGTPDMDFSVSVGIASDGNYFLTGNRSTESLPWVIKTNSAGDIQWTKALGEAKGKRSQALGQASTSDGGVAIFGIYDTGNFITKYNADGSLAWTQYLNGTFEGVCTLKQTSDGGFILAGKIPECTATECAYRFACQKMNVDGNIAWSKKLEPEKGESKNVVQTTDGGFVFTGWYWFKDAAQTKLVSTKIDKNGNTLWSKAYGSKDSFGEYTGVTETPDGGLLILGSENSQTYLIKTDVNGNSSCNVQTLNQKVENINSASASAIVIPQDKESFITKEMPCTEAALIIKDSLLCGSITCVENIEQNHKFFLYPNPFVETISLYWLDQSAMVQNPELSLFNSLGENILHTQAKGSQFHIDRNVLPAGLYFYQLQNGNTVIGHGRLVAQ